MLPIYATMPLRIYNCRREGKNYEYQPGNFNNEEDALREEDGLQELRDLGYIEIDCLISIQEIKVTKCLSIIVTDITRKSNNFIREYLANENASPIEEAIKNTQNIYEQAHSHLVQARKHIVDMSDQRSRKDTLRDCVSAMEALVKNITGANDLKDAIKNLKDQRYSRDTILRDGLTIWQGLCCINKYNYLIFIYFSK